MKREIKFRAKIVIGIESLAIKKGHWVEGYYYEDLQDGVWCSWIKERDDILHYKVDKDTLGQFTGLLDKNGTEIYEGDIIRYTDIDSYVVIPDCDAAFQFSRTYAKIKEDAVEFNNGAFVLSDDIYHRDISSCGFNSINDILECVDVGYDDCSDCKGTVINESLLGIEVIGNIHDTPELLKGGAE